MDQPELLEIALDVLDAAEVPYMLVGSLASGVYGEARMTRDIDLLIDPSDSQLQVLFASFPPPEFYTSEAGAADAMKRGGMFNVIHTESGNKIDFVIAEDRGWNAAQFQRRRVESIVPSRRGYVASPEDMIIAKMQYYQQGQSEKHLRDIAAMLQVADLEVDTEYIARWSTHFRLGDIWLKILDQIDH